MCVSWKKNQVFALLSAPRHICIHMVNTSHQITTVRITHRRLTTPCFLLTPTTTHRPPIFVTEVVMQNSINMYLSYRNESCWQSSEVTGAYESGTTHLHMYVFVLIFISLVWLWVSLQFTTIERHLFVIDFLITISTKTTNNAT